MAIPSIMSPEWCQSSFGANLLLKQSEVTIIRQTWKLACQAERRPGDTLMASCVKQIPAYRQCYGLTSNDVPECLNGKNQRLVAQANRLQHFFDSAVKVLNAESNSVLLQLARSTGALHFHRGVTLDAVNWLIYKEIVISEMDCYHQRAADKFGIMGSLSPHFVRKRTSSLPFSQDNKLVANANQLAPPTATMITDPGQMSDTRIAWYKFMTLIIREMKYGVRCEALYHCERRASADSGVELLSARGSI